MRREHPVIVMTMPPRRGDQRGETVEEFEWGEAQLRLATGQRLGQRVADLLIVTVPTQPLTGEGGGSVRSSWQFSRRGRSRTLRVVG